MDETAFKGGILALFSTAGSSFTKVRKDLSLMKHSAGKENGLRLGIKWFGFVLICWFCLLQVKCLSLCSSWERWINPFRRWIFQWPKSKVYIFFFPLQISMGLIWSKIYLKQWYQILIGPLTPSHVSCLLSCQDWHVMSLTSYQHPFVTFRVTLFTALRLTSVLLIQVDCPCCSSSWWVSKVVLNWKSTDQF